MKIIKYILFVFLLIAPVFADEAQNQIESEIQKYNSIQTTIQLSYEGIEYRFLLIIQILLVHNEMVILVVSTKKII